IGFINLSTACALCSAARSSIATSTRKCPLISSSPSRKISSAASLPPKLAARLSFASAAPSKPKNSIAKPVACRFSKLCSKTCASPFACCASLPEYTYGLSSIAGGSEPARVNVSAVSRDFFKSLGVEPFLGRTFVAEEQREHGAPAIIVSYGYWQRYLASATDLAQFHLAMDG